MSDFLDGSGLAKVAQAINSTGANFAPQYSASATYSVGDYVVYGRALYRCNAGISSPEAWNPSHWTQTTYDAMRRRETATNVEINRLFETEYQISASVTHGTIAGDSSIWSGETAALTITPDIEYYLPSSVTVFGATFAYDFSTGVVALSDATENVTITATCQAHVEMPSKGDIITLDGRTARYRVLKASGIVVEVLALDDVASNYFNSSLVTTTFSDGSTGQKYEGSTLDNYMNSTFYNSLSTNIKNAIVQKAITQSIYKSSSSEISECDFAINRITSGTYRYKRKGQVSVGNRYCYALDLNDVAEYFGAWSGSTISGADLNDMFFEQTTAISKYVWLDSANSVNPGIVFLVSGYDGYVDFNNPSNLYVARPAFQVDLSQVSWVKE